MRGKVHPVHAAPFFPVTWARWLHGLLVLLVFLTWAVSVQAVQEPSVVGSDAPQPGEGEKDDRLRIAILEFDAVNEEAKAGNKGRMVAEMLTTEAFKTGLFHVVERHLIKKVMDEMEFGEAGFSGTEAQKIGVMLGADAVLTGAVSEFLGVLRIDARLINVQDGRILLADGAQAQLTMQDISQAVQLLMGKMISAVGAEQGVAVAESTPPLAGTTQGSKPTEAQAPTSARPSSDSAMVGEQGFGGSPGPNGQGIGGMLGVEGGLVGMMGESLGMSRPDEHSGSVHGYGSPPAEDQRVTQAMPDISSPAVQKYVNKITPGEGGKQGVAPGEVARPQTQQTTISAMGRPVQGQPWQDSASGLSFAWLPGGCFLQGSPTSELGRDNDEKQHEVCLEGFWMSTREVTVDDFRRFVEATGYVTDAEREGFAWIYQGTKTKVDGQSWRRTRFPQTAGDPVINVSWYDAMAYCNWLARETGLHFRLPTESEWEYGCRAGAKGRYFWGEDASRACAFANVHDRTSKNVNGYTWQSFPCNDGFAQTAPTGSFQPNAYGLHDMLGNVWEWTGSADGSGKRYARGGSWDDRDKYVRCANRDRLDPQFRTYSVGFRPVLAQ